MNQIIKMVDLNNKTTTCKVPNWFLEEFINKIKVNEEEKGNYNCSIPVSFNILGKRILKAGGLKE